MIFDNVINIKTIMNSQTHQLVTYYMNLINEQINQGTDFTGWLLDAEPQFSSQYTQDESKINYFKENLPQIVQYFVNKNKIKDRMPYTDFAF